VVAGLAAGCAAPAAVSAPELRLTIAGERVLDPLALETTAERELNYALSFGYLARTGHQATSCWFARTDNQTEVDSRLWCGPVQVPGSTPAADWVPVPLRKAQQRPDGVALTVQPPQVPPTGQRSYPVGPLVRTDGELPDPNQLGDAAAGPGFLAVLPDDGKRGNAELGLTDRTALIRDDLLEVAVTGTASPASFPVPGGTLRAEHGQQLRVTRIHVLKPLHTDPAFTHTDWQSWAPQPSELALRTPGRQVRLPDDKLPDDGGLLLLYTVPDNTGNDAAQHEQLVLNTAGTQSLEQHLDLVTGRTDDTTPAVLRRPSGPPRDATTSQAVRISTPTGPVDATVSVTGVRLGRLRPTLLATGGYRMVAASGPDRALLELRLAVTGDGVPVSPAGDVTKDHVQVTLPDGTIAGQVGVRFGGGMFPVAVIYEVPADTRSVQVTVTPANLTLPAVGPASITVPGAPMSLPLTF
jgi:hypothetical protein